MYSAKSFKLTKKEYDYLLPVLRSKLLSRALSGGGDEYSFVSDNIECLDDMLCRLKGVYGYFGEFPSLMAYKYSVEGSLDRFRKFCKN